MVKIILTVEIGLIDGSGPAVRKIILRLQRKSGIVFIRREAGSRSLKTVKKVYKALPNHHR
jgi:hypothetical protein